MRKFGVKSRNWTLSLTKGRPTDWWSVMLHIYFLDLIRKEIYNMSGKNGVVQP
jgi:hypothetical protein